MAEIDTVGLYLVVFVLICGILGLFKFALNISKLSREMDDQREWGEWVDRHKDHQFPAIPYPHDLYTPTLEWSYCGLDGHEVVLYDPADAYEYVVQQLQDCNRSIDSVESTVIGDLRGQETWTWHDLMIERDYWFSELREFEY